MHFTRRSPIRVFPVVLLTLLLTTSARGVSSKWVARAEAELEVNQVVESSPCLVDLDNDRRPEVVIGSGGGRVYAYRSSGGSFLISWFVETGGPVFSSPAAGDIDGDGRPEIVFGSEDGKVYAVEHSGSSVPGWPKTTGGPVRGSAVIADLDDSGYADVFIAGEDGYLYGWDYRGYAISGFPYNLGASSESSPTVGDIDDDGKLEILIGDDNGLVHALNHDATPLEGWPQRTDFSVKSSPALGDIDTDGYLEIVVGSYDFKVYAWKPNGMLLSGWPVTTEYRIFHSSPTFADMDGDGGVEVVIASGDGRVYAFKEDGRTVPGFPLDATLVDGGSPSAIKGSTSIADLDGNGYLDIVVGAEDGVIYAWETTGIETPGFPWTGMQGFPIRSTPAIGDLDGNGATEIVYGTNFAGKIECIEMGGGSYNAANQPWPMFLNNPSHVTLFGHGEVPKVTIDAIEGEQTGDIVVSYHIEDRQGDMVDLEVLYTDDSGLYWHYASTTGKVTGLSRGEYNGTVTWHSRDDLDHVEDTDIKIKLMPKDHSGLGRAIESTIIHLDNNDPPRVVFEPLEGEQTEDVFIDYRLEDDEGDELAFVAEYSTDGGATWIESWIEGNTDYIDRAHYTDQLWWDSMADLPNRHIDECLFAITPSDRDPGERTVLGPFVLDNNQPPTMYVENLTGEQYGGVDISYEVMDEEGDACSLVCYFSKDFGQTWAEATVEGQLAGVGSSPDGAMGSLVWRSDRDLPDLDESAIQFRIIPSDLDEGEEDDTVPFQVDNNAPPSARVVDIVEEVFGEVLLTFSIDDPEDDMCDIVLEYTLDGGTTWNPATTKESIEPLDKSLVRGYNSAQPSHTVTWLSVIDADQTDSQQAMLRLTAQDNDVSESPSITVAFHLDNNATPTLVVDNVTEESTGDVPISYSLDDRERDLLSILTEWSDDGGVTFYPATVSGRTSGIGPEGYRGEVTWNSAADFDGRDQQNIVLKITVSDNDTGDAAATSQFWVDNSEPPSVMLTAITEEVTADIPIKYKLSDREGDPLSIVCEYSDDGGASWKTASVTGQTDSISSSAYAGTIVWNSASDTTGTDQTDIHFRVRPFDNDEGASHSIGAFQVDNSFEPTVTIATVLEGEQTNDIPFDFTLSDVEGDTLTLVAEYSQDGGSFWEPATTTGQLTKLTPELYSGRITWNSKTDLLGADLNTLVFRLIPADNDPGEPDSVGPFHLDNNAVPSAKLDPVEGEQEGDVVIRYSLFDDEGDIDAILPEYSVDGGATWKEATTKGLTVASYTGELIWESVADTDGLDSTQVVFRITPEDNDVGEPGITPPFQVDNNHVPKVNVADYEREQTGDVTVVYNVNDRESDYVGLTVEYSTDGGATFKPATVTGKTEGVGPTPYEGSLTWNSVSDIPGVDSSQVVLRVTPADNDTGESGQNRAFQVDNSSEPGVTIAAITEEQSGDVVVSYTLSDVEGDPLSIVPEFSPDGGASWKPATVTGAVEAIPQTAYAGRITWQSAVDMDMVDNFQTHFRLRPFDNDEGESFSIGPFQVDNSDVPSVTVVTPEGEQDDDVSIAFQITDREGDPVTISPEFSRDGGKTWEPATVTGQTTSIAQSAYAGAVVWNSKTDTDQLDLFDVQFRLTPSDNDVGEPYTTATFQVDNSDAPTIALTPITEEQTAYVMVEYRISDREGDPVILTPEWSPDGGATWHEATITALSDIGQPEGIRPDGYAGSLEWNSKHDTDLVDLETVTFRITPADNDVGEPAVTGPFRLDNSDVPTIALVTPEGEQTDDIVIAYTISDREGDPIDIEPEFSRDRGATWEPATVTGRTETIAALDYSASMVWNSKSDTDMLDLFEVQFRLTPSDNDTGEPVSTGVFQVDNSDIPSIVLTDITEEQTVDVTIRYQISDREGDPVSLVPEYSIDGGATWKEAVVTGTITKIPSSSYSGSLVWNSKSNIDTLDSTTVVFRLTPADNDTGTSDVTAPFQVDNSDPPTIKLTDLTEEQTEDVVIAYQIADREGDPVSLTCEYSPDGGATWKPAAVTGQTEAIASSGYSGNIVWNSVLDVDMLDLFEVQFRITPADNDTGELDATANFQVDNSDPPVASLGAVEAEVFGDIIIPYNLSDREGDPLDILCEFSIDGGDTWRVATVKNATESLTGAGYSGDVVWDSVSDLFGVDAEDVVFRVTPSDNDVGEAATVR
jgi:hypothetical protein